MAIKLSVGPRFDTRGLPEGYDPHKLYEYRYDILVKDATGLESLVYKLIPFSYIKSFAFAIDPTARFKVSPYTVTPVNRTQYRGVNSVLLQRPYTRKRYKYSYSQSPNYKGISICWNPVPDIIFGPSVDLLSSGFLPSQPVLLDRIKDTTKRTRLVGSDRGNLEMFKGYVSSPPRETKQGEVSNYTFLGDGSTGNTSCIAVGGGGNRIRYSHEYQIERHARGATLSVSNYNLLRDGEIALAKSLCQKHAISMLKSVDPFARDYTLFRNLVELRDIPRSVRQLSQTAQDLRKVYLSLRTSPKLRKVVFNLKGLARDVPNEYLSYHFGWKQLYRDVTDLLALPEKTAKKVNFLMSRSGKPTTLRSKREFLSGSAGASGFDYSTMNTEHTRVSSSRIERKHELRLVINAIWDFPPINSVEFKKHVFAQRTGISPRITDVYNLVPWTWLVDWFTGVGNYIDLIDTINNDPKLINSGMISCRTSGRLITDLSSKSTITSSVTSGGVTTTQSNLTDNRHTSFYDFECQTRNDVATILDVQLTSVPSTLTTFQKSILGALILQRTKFLR
jgi:hypothetical protein